MKEINNVVIFDSNFKENNPIYYYGLIVNLNPKKRVVNLLKIDKTNGVKLMSIPENFVFELSEKNNIVHTIKNEYIEKRKEILSNFKSIKRIDYGDELLNKYNLLKKEIIKTAKNMVERDNLKFEDRLKAICSKKKQLFAIECDGVSDARKHNGKLKFVLKELEDKYAKDLTRLLEADYVFLELEAKNILVKK